jgi:hypothetical protein
VKTARNTFEEGCLCSEITYLEGRGFLPDCSIDDSAFNFNRLAGSLQSHSYFCAVEHDINSLTTCQILSFLYDVVFPRIEYHIRTELSGDLLSRGR